MAMLLLAACVPVPVRNVASTVPDPIRAAFVVLGENAVPVARAITESPSCPPVDADGTMRAMSVRAAPSTERQRPTVSTPALSKPSVFPILICELALPGVRRASVGGHPLPLPGEAPRRFVIIGDSGCRLKTSDGINQACNDPDAWPFAQVAASAAATHPDVVIHVGDYHYRETACPAGDRGCAGSPWGYGWDAWNADLFVPARALFEAAPWIVVRGNHESCNRAGQGWWRLLDPRELVPRRDCNDPADDDIGDFSEPYAVPLVGNARWIVFDSSKVGVAPLKPADAMYVTYAAQLRTAIELGSRSPMNFFLDHHPILGFAPNPTLTPTGLFPGNGSLQSVLLPMQGEPMFPERFEALLSGHVHLFELVSYATAQPTQLISGNAGAWADVPLPRELPAGATPLPGAVIASIVSTNQSGFTIIERDSEGGWRVEAHDRHGRLFTTCTLRDRKTRCVPETLP
jgi:calcineurin-like phosphoesterase family protein